MFIFIIVGLLVFSFLLALYSLWRDLKKNIKTEQVSEELSKGRVVFHAPTMPDMPLHQEAMHEQPSEFSREHRKSVYPEPNIPSQPTTDIHSNIPSPQSENSIEQTSTHSLEQATSPSHANLKIENTQQNSNEISSKESINTSHQNTNHIEESTNLIKDGK